MCVSCKSIQIGLRWYDWHIYRERYEVMKESIVIHTSAEIVENG